MFRARWPSPQSEAEELCGSAGHQDQRGWAFCHHPEALLDQTQWDLGPNCKAGPRHCVWTAGPDHNIIGLIHQGWNPHDPPAETFFTPLSTSPSPHRQEWPHAWENFIPDLCGSCKTNQLLCENNLRILNMLSRTALTRKGRWPKVTWGDPQCMFDPRNYTLLPHCAHRIEYMYIYIYIFFREVLCWNGGSRGLFRHDHGCRGAPARWRDLHLRKVSHGLQKSGEVPWTLVQISSPWKNYRKRQFFFGCENNSFLYLYFPLHKPIYW